MLSIGVLSSALLKLEQNPFPQSFEFAKNTFTYIASEMSPIARGFHFPCVLSSLSSIWKHLVVRVCSS